MNRRTFLTASAAATAAEPAPLRPPAAVAERTPPCPVRAVREIAAA